MKASNSPRALNANICAEMVKKMFQPNVCKCSLIATLNATIQEGFQIIERERQTYIYTHTGLQHSCNKRSNQLRTLFRQCLFFPINERYFKIIYLSQRPKFRAQKLYWTLVGKFNPEFLSLGLLMPRGVQELNKNIFLEKAIVSTTVVKQLQTFGMIALYACVPSIKQWQCTGLFFTLRDPAHKLPTS